MRISSGRRSAPVYFVVGMLSLLTVDQVHGFQHLPIRTTSSTRIHHGPSSGSRAQPSRSHAVGRTTRRSCTTSSTSALFTIGLLDATVATASISATAKLLSSIGLGGLAAHKQNLLDASAISALSRLTYWVFQPAFLFCSVAKTVYTANNNIATGAAGLSLRALWLMPAVAVVQIVMGTCIGRLLSKLFGLKDQDEIRNVHMCTTFANSGPLPLIFADALFASSYPGIQTQVAAGISFYLLAWSPLFWTFGKMILGTEDDETETKVEEGTASSPYIGKRLMKKISSGFAKVRSPPVIGSMTGLAVGMNPFLREIFFGSGIATPLYSSLQTLGTAYLPAALLVLAGSLVGGSSSNNTSEDDNKRSTTTSAKGIGAIATSRFLVSPLLSLLAVFWIRQLSWMDGPTKSILTFLCLMEGCMPPAQNSVILLQLAGRTEQAASMAKLLTMLYAGAVLPVTILMTACLSISGILNLV